MSFEVTHERASISKGYDPPPVGCSASARGFFLARSVHILSATEPGAVASVGQMQSLEDHAMRSMTTLAAALLIGAPLVTVGTPARAENDFMGQAQRFLNGNSGNDRDAYQRGRDDEMRHQQAEQDRDRVRRDYDRDASRDRRYREPDYGDRNSYR